jgi:vesicle-fusing ATPase
VLFSKRPPKGRRLLVIATSSLKGVLNELGLVDNFDSDLRVPPIASLLAVDYVLRELELFRTTEERKATMAQLEGVGFPTRDEEEGERPLQIGIKKLLTIIEMARQAPENVGQRLLSALMGLGM